MAESIVILDCGSQVTQLLARRVREIGVYSEVYPGNIDSSILHEKIKTGLKGIILSGSYHSVHKEDSLNIPPIIFEIGVPVLGICYGMHAMAQYFGGKVAPSRHREFGYTKISIDKPNRLFDNLITSCKHENSLEVWMSHNDVVTKLPFGFERIASTIFCPIAGMENQSRQLYAIQFHPEVTHTPQGKKILENFVRNICNCSVRWTTENYVDDAIKEIQRIVGDEKIILGLSGGLDSTVSAVLLKEAVGKQLICIFVDHGLLPINEKKYVKEYLESDLDIKIVFVNAKDRFMKKLSGISDPELKRKIIGKEFIQVFKEKSEEQNGVKWLAQGTIYPDVVESAGHGSGNSALIKSHHNVGGLPISLGFKLLEPLRRLFKDEVRKLGSFLGLPNRILNKQPLPGPGLGVRILGEVKEEFVELLRQADAIFIEELSKAKDEKTGLSLYEGISQAFAVFLPIKSVGVMGDNRTYEHVIALRAIHTLDFMTADWVHLPHKVLMKISSRITNEIQGINRVVYDISSKPPATIEWE